MSKCFYSTDGTNTSGPISLEELKNLYREGKISAFGLFAEEDTYPGDPTYSVGSYSCWKPALYLSENTPATQFPSQLGVLGRYVGALIAANITDPLKFEAARLHFVGTDYFSVSLISSGLPIHYPASSILSLREWPSPVPYLIHRPIDLTLRQGTLSKIFTGKIEEKQPEFIKVQVTAPLAIEIYHNVIYNSGGSLGIGIGMAIPI